MKRILYILPIILFIGCSESFLEETPMTEKVDANFYSTDKEVFEALTACYKVLQKEEYQAFWQIAEIASDNCFGGSGASEGNVPWDDFKAYNQRNFCFNLWEKDYEGIFRCNTLLLNVESKDWGEDQNLINGYLAEARFLRAYYYFELARVFENVPLFELPENDIYRRQAPVDDLYALITGDLLYAIKTLPSKEYATTTQGRITKWAAESLLARVYLFYTGYYNKPNLVDSVDKATITTYINDVIDNSGHELVADFRTLWGYAIHQEYLQKLTGDSSLVYAGEGNQEVVFAIKYSNTGVWSKYEGAHWIKYNGIRTSAIDPIAGGWGFAPVNPKIWNAYQEEDTRKSGSILSIEGEGLKNYTDDDQYEETGLWQKKYIPISIDGQDILDSLGKNNQFGQPYDFMAIRYSDVLLMGAELNLDTDIEKAQTCLDSVRNRAFKGTAPKITVSKESIMEERRLELAFEAVRYYDLLRQGMDITKAAIDETDVPVRTGGKEVLKSIDFRKETRGLFQIPNSEIVLSEGTLQQNEGWEE